MERAPLPKLNSWADIGLTLVADNSQGSLEVLFSSSGNLNDNRHQNALADHLQNAIGVLTPGDAEDQRSTLIALFHNGGKVGAVCEHSAPPGSEDAIREIVAAILFQAQEFNRPEPTTLDPKEIAYLKKVAEGFSDAEIADELNLSLRAVKERKKRTLTDLGAASIAHAIAIATASRQI